LSRPDLLLALLLAGLTAASRIPYRARLLSTWDAVQFALALREYEIVRHQPHPPGYVLYVGAGRLLDAWLDDPAASLTWLSVGASAAAVGLVFSLARILYDRATAVVAALLLGASPLGWFYGEVALPYSLEGALATGVALLVWPMRTGRTAFAGWSALALAIAGGVRPSLLVVLGPFWLAMAWTGLRRWRPVVTGLGLMALVSALWLLPILYLSGGLGRYVWAARELYESTVRPTTITAADGEWPGNVRAFLESLLMGLGLLVPLLAVVVGRSLAALRRWEAREWFLAAWIAPPIAVYVTVHFGQYAYVLTVLPALWLLVAQALVAWARGWDDGTAARMRRVLAASLVGAVLATHAGYFARAEGIDVPAAASARERGAAALRAFYRYRLWAHTAHGLAERDGVIAAYVGAIRGGFDPRETVVVTELGNPRSYPWFRHATYYLPEFTVVHLRLGRFSRGHLSSPGLDTMEARPGPEVPLPPGTRRLVWMVDSWNPLLPQPRGLREVALPHGRWLYVLEIEGPVAHGAYRLVAVP
jgi:hypothetical protein